VITVSGSFLIGLLMTLFAERYTVDPARRLRFLVGFLGAETTFPTFQYETGNLVKDSEWLFAAMNVSLSVVPGLWH